MKLFSNWFFFSKHLDYVNVCSVQNADQKHSQIALELVPERAFNALCLMTSFYDPSILALLMRLQWVWTRTSLWNLSSKRFRFNFLVRLLSDDKKFIRIVKLQRDPLGKLKNERYKNWANKNSRRMNPYYHWNTFEINRKVFVDSYNDFSLYLTLNE